jgi:hypothetical protein
MSQSLTINDREYIPAGEVGRHFGYTRDYILTLSRDGKIDGRKVGHRWYVNLDSAKTFFESAQAEREVRRQVVSEVRKAELRSHQQNSVGAHVSTALTETLAILVIGLLMGVTGYLGTSTQQQATLSDSDFSFFKELAISFYEFISPQGTVVTETKTEAKSSENISAKTAVADEVSNVPDSIVYDDLVATTTYTSLVIGTEQVLTTTTVESIRESFSDEVSVSIDPHNPDMGVVIPNFKDAEGESYRFFMVPVTPQENQN